MDLIFVFKGHTCNFLGGTNVGVVGWIGSDTYSLIQSIFHVMEITKGKNFFDGDNISTIGLHDLR